MEQEYPIAGRNPVAPIPEFRGAAEVVELLRRLCRRPRWGELPDPQSPRKGLPLLCLIRRRRGEGTLLEALATYLEQAEPYRIPYAWARLLHDADPDQSPMTEEELYLPAVQEDVEHVRRTLRCLAQGIGRARFGRAGRIRFPRFDLVDWLMRQQLEAAGDGDRDRQNVLRERLRERELERSWLLPRIRNDAADVAGKLAIQQWFRVLLLVALRALPPLLSRLKQWGRIPLFSAEYRWFLRCQPYLTPRDPGTFLGFAERLTEEARQGENPEQLARLLVHSFFEDVRRAYGRLPWRLQGPRRMSYCVVLMDDITRRNRGYLLLRLINDVRNETGLFDPVVVITASEKVPPLALPEFEAGIGGAVPAEQALIAYDGWTNSLLRKSRAGGQTAWYLQIEIPQSVNVRLALARASST